MTIETGSLGAVYIASGSDTLTDEAMSEVNLTSQGRARYSVYQITDPTTRYLVANGLAVFQADTGGDSNFVAVTPERVEHCGGRIFLSTPRGATDVVRCHSASYYPTLTPIIACVLSKIRSFYTEHEKTAIGDTAVQRDLGLQDWEGTIEALLTKASAELETSGGNANSHIKLVHTEGGDVGNDISLTIVDPATPSQSLSVGVVSTAITVNLATNAGGDETSTAAEVMAALNASIDVRLLGCGCFLSDGENGSGVVAALAETDLTGGLDLENFTAWMTSVYVFIFYDYYSAGERWEGFGQIQDIDWPNGPKDGLIKASMSVKGKTEGLNYRAS